MASGSSNGPFSSLLTEEAEGQWFSLAAFVMVMLLGAALIHVADVIPSGTENYPLEEGKTIVSMAFGEEGVSLAVVEESGTNQLFRIQGSEVTLIPLPSEPLVVSSSETEWLVGGESGLLVRVSGVETTVLPLLLPEDRVIDLHAADGSSGWILIERGPNVELRTFDSRIQNSLSFAADVDDESLLMTGFEVAPSGNTAIVRGLTSSFSNPASPSDVGEVLFVATASIGFAPDVILVQHGMGEPYHSVHISEDSSLIGFAVSNDHTTLIGADLSVSTVSELGGGSASIVDSEGRLWLFGEDSMVSVLSADGSIQTLSVESPENFLPESAISDGEILQVIHDGGHLLVIDSSSLTDPVRRPSLLFDGLFLAIAAGACLVLVRNFQVMGFDAW
jgi:hypothetical protein